MPCIETLQHHMHDMRHGQESLPIEGSSSLDFAPARNCIVSKHYRPKSIIFMDFQGIPKAFACKTLPHFYVKTSPRHSVGDPWLGGPDLLGTGSSLKSDPTTASWPLHDTDLCGPHHFTKSLIRLLS